MTLKFKSGRLKWLELIPLELILWVAALILLGTSQPAVSHERKHFTFCPLANMGLSWCPGCGLGRSVTHLLHGNIMESIRFHWLGIPAVLIIGYRIIVLGSYQLKK